MIVYYFLFLIITLWGIRWIRKDERRGILGLDRISSVALNGVFVAVVMIRHMWQGVYGFYVHNAYNPQNWLDFRFMWIDSLWRQLLVVSFLFYSGFGVVEQIKVKGRSYIKDFPKKRIFVVWANFAVAIVFFGILNFVFGNYISIKQFIAAFGFVRQIGNPAWYIACILWCYVVVWLVAKLTDDFIKLRFISGGGVLAGISLWVGVVCMIKGNGASTWYNTSFAFAMGVVVSLYKKEIEQIVERFYWPILLISLMGFIITYNVDWLKFSLMHNVVSVFFMASLLLLSCRIKIGNPILLWLGRHVFPIYMYEFLVILLVDGLLPAPATQFAAISYSAAIIMVTLVIANFYSKWRISL